MARLSPFCGYAGLLLVTLGGLVGHLRGRDSSADRTWSHSFAIRSAVLNGDEPEQLGRDLTTAVREICITLQPVRFLARVINRGLLPEGSVQREFVLAAPLHVETVYTADEAVTRGQSLDPTDPARIGRCRDPVARPVAGRLPVEVEAAAERVRER